MTTRNLAARSARVLAPLLVAPLLGCPVVPSGPNPPGGGTALVNTNPQLVPFGSPDELVGYVKGELNARAQRYNSRNAFFPFFLAAPAADANVEATAGAAGDASAAGNSQSHSTTNIQEDGVDESDVVKSDGTYFYIARGNSLRIVRAAPAAQLAELARLDLELPVDSLYLYRGKLIALGTRYSYDYGPAPFARLAIEFWPPYYADVETVVAEVDVSDPAAPRVTRRIALDGALVSSRLTNDRLITVLTVVPPLPEIPTPADADAVTLDDVLPKVRVAGGEAFAVAWSELLRPLDPGGLNMTAVVTLDAANVETIVASTGIMASASTIYASTEALYVTDAEYDPESNYREVTALHMLAFDDQGAARYTASGAVPGRLLNQFSLGEHEGHLRVATHVDNTAMFLGGPFFGGFEIAVANVDPALAQNRNVQPDGTATTDIPPQRPPQPYNAVYVLANDGGTLKIAGALENIAPGERIYSARFMGDRGFLVTFRQIDPLFAMDLSDPTMPQIKGDLKVPGFSDYLHPLGANHLIGVGRSTTENPWGGITPDAVQLSLFDVSNLSDPQVVEQITLGGPYSSSDVSYTHKAFTYLPDRGLLAIPVQLNHRPQSRFEYPGVAFDGVVVFRVDSTGFTEIARVSSVTHDPSLYYGGWVAWRRAAFVGDFVYSITDAGVKSALIADFGQTNFIELAPEPTDFPIYYGIEGDGIGGAAPGVAVDVAPARGG